MSKSRWAVMLAAVVVVATVLAAYAAGKAKTAVPKVVRAQAFELVDARGKVRGVLDVTSGSPGLALFDAKGKGRALLDVGPDGTPDLVLRDARGKRRATLSVLNDGRPALELSDEQGKTRAALGATQLETTRTGAVENRAESSLVLFDKEGKVLWQAP